jgi:hypothetical protein
MSRRKIAVLVTAKILEIIISLLLIYSMWRLVNWINPAAFKLNVTLCAILAVDYALIAAEITPRGFRDWFGRKKRL